MGVVDGEPLEPTSPNRGCRFAVDRYAQWGSICQVTPIWGTYIVHFVGPTLWMTKCSRLRTGYPVVLLSNEAGKEGLHRPVLGVVGPLHSPCIAQYSGLWEQWRLVLEMYYWVTCAPTWSGHVESRYVRMYVSLYALDLVILKGKLWAFLDFAVSVGDLWAFLDFVVLKGDL